MNLRVEKQSVTIEARDDFPINKGGLCAKGWTSAELLKHRERLTSPLIKNASGSFEEVSWAEATRVIASSVESLQAEHGNDTIAVFGSGSLTNEKAYLLGKFARVALKTSNIDYNGRFCMSSAAAAASRSLGIDRGMPFPVEDVRHADTILLAGANPAETMPVFMSYFKPPMRAGGRLIVIDPRKTATAAQATLHLQNQPGTDLIVANGILHVLIRNQLIDSKYIEERTEDFEQVRSSVAAYWPEQVERMTGVPEPDIELAAKMLGTVRKPMILTGRGIEQQSQGVNNVSAFINIALALGSIGKRRAGWGCITGQGNGQGAREHGLKTDQLPGYRSIFDPEARSHMAAVWGVDEADIPKGGKSAYELLDSLGTENGPHAMFIVGSNVAVSAPNSINVKAKLEALDLLVVSDFFMSETAELADVVLPSSMWAEESGTMTNLEGRVVLRNQGVDAPGFAQSDLQMICQLAASLGYAEKFNYSSAEDVFNELREASKGGKADYSGITYERLESENGIFWPAPSSAPEGQPRLFANNFPTPSGKAKFFAARHRDIAEVPDRAYPLYLTTGRIAAQYQSGTQTRRVSSLNERAAVPFAELHPTTARKLALRDGEKIRAISRRGSSEFHIKISTSARLDTVFVPFHWGGMQSVNRLTNPALDPVSRMPEFKACAVRIEPVDSVDSTKKGDQ